MGYDYDVVVLGGGTSGLTAASIAANLGAKTALIESDRLGGDCTWTGGVPTRALAKAASVAYSLKKAGRFGMSVSSPEIAYDRVLAYIHRAREAVYRESDSPEIVRSNGIHLFEGVGSFLDPHTIEVDGTKPRQLRGRNIFIATGSHPVMPRIHGLDAGSCQTAKTIFDVPAFPHQLLIIGAGRLGCELGQAFARLGSSVTIIDEAPSILAEDDEELSSMLQDCLEDDGVRFVLHARITKVVSTGSAVIAEIEQGGHIRSLPADQILVAVGSEPHLNGLKLDAAGVDHDPQGIITDDRCRTNIKHIFAIGDVMAGGRSHLAEHSARVAVANALRRPPARIDGQHIPWCTFTSPELAHVGTGEFELKETGTGYDVHRLPHPKTHRVGIDGAVAGITKVFVGNRTGKVLGVTILGPRASDQISQFALAMRNRMTLEKMAEVIPYFESTMRLASSTPAEPVNL